MQLDTKDKKVIKLIRLTKKYLLTLQLPSQKKTAGGTVFEGII